MKADDKARAEKTPWYSFLDGQGEDYPVKALHAAGIEVILDVVFNHTAEGNGYRLRMHERLGPFRRRRRKCASGD